MDQVNEHIYFAYARKNIGLLIAFSACVLVAFPITGIVLPRTYTNMIKGLTENAPTVGKTMLTIVGLWAVVLSIRIGMQSLNIELFPKGLYHHIRQEMYDHIIDRYSEKFEQVKSGETLERISGVSRNLTFHMEWLIRTAAPYVIAMLIIVVYLYTKSVTIGTIAMAGVLGSAGVTYFYGKRIVEMSSSREKVMTDVSQKMNNSFENLKNVYINNQQEDNKNTMQDSNQEHAEKTAKELSMGRNMKITITVITLTTFAAVVLFSYMRLKDGTAKSTTRFEIGAIMLIFLTYIGWVRSLFFEAPFVFHRMGVLKNSEEFLTSIFAKKDDKDLTRIGITRGRIEFQNVTFGFEKTKKVLQNFSAVFHANKMTAITGRSGIGKSVTMHLVIGLYAPETGHILVDGIPVSKLDKTYLRRQVIYVNQRDDMWEKSIKYNMLFGNEDKEARLKELVLKYNLLPMFSDKTTTEYSSGQSCEEKEETTRNQVFNMSVLDKDTGVNGSNLSNGMRKVIIIVRTLLNTDATVYLFDEPTTGLDPCTSKKVISMIETECKGKTIVIITHSDIVRKRCQYVVQL